MRLFTVKVGTRVVGYCDDCKRWGAYGFPHKCEASSAPAWFASLTELMVDQFGQPRADT